MRVVESSQKGLILVKKRGNVILGMRHMVNLKMYANRQVIEKCLGNAVLGTLTIFSGNDIVEHNAKQLETFRKVSGNASGNANGIFSIKSTKRVPSSHVPIGNVPKKFFVSYRNYSIHAFPFPKLRSQKICNNFVNLSIPTDTLYYV